MKNRTLLLLLSGLAVVIAAILFVLGRPLIATMRRQACYRNLMHIDAAKMWVGSQLGLKRPNLFTVEDAETMSPKQISHNRIPYIEGRLPKCPAGGDYTIGYYGQNTICSLHGVLIQADEMSRSACEGDVAALIEALNDDYGPNGATFKMALPWTPLHSAALTGQSAVVSLLLQEGAKVNPMTQLGQTPLDLATDPDVIRILQKHAKKSELGWALEVCVR